MPRLAQAAGLIVLCYWLLLFGLTHVPLSGAAGTLVEGGHADKLAHCLAYAGLAFLLCQAAGLQWGVRQGHLALVLLVLVAYAALDEWSQGLVPTRQTDEMDWVADVLGLGLGLSAFSLVGQPLLGCLPRGRAAGGGPQR